MTKDPNDSSNKPDFVVASEGSLVLFWPITDAAMKFLDGITTPANAHLRFGKSMAVEPRYAMSFDDQLNEEGFTVQW